MAEIVSISLTRQDIEKAKRIKQTQGLGKSDIFRFGLNVLFEERLKDYEELKASNDKLYQNLKKIQKELWEFNEYQEMKKEKLGVKNEN